MQYKLMKQEIEESNLNEKQKLAYCLMAQGKNVFITGGAGTGKSFCIQKFRSAYNGDRIIAMTSLTGVSALAVKGTTIHSYLGIGLGTGSIGALSTNILKKQYLRKRWRQLQTLIIDEISMMDHELFDKLEEIARRVRDCGKPFGGIQLIVSGDFLQLPTIGKHKFCFDAESWDKCITNTVYLTEIIRQKDELFQKCLNNVRIGNITEEVKEILESRVNFDLTNEHGILPTQFFATNADVDEINEEELDKLAEDGREFFEYEMKVDVYQFIKNRDYVVTKYIKDCPAVDKLQLCVGAQVMLLHNLDINSGLINGSRGVVTKFVENKPMVKFLNGVETIIDYHVWEIEQDDQKLMSITQVPLRLGYAFTIHKCQGTTLNYAIVDLSNCFTFGMCYVALSRVRSLNGLSIRGIEFDRIQAHPLAVQYYKNLEE